LRPCNDIAVFGLNRPRVGQEEWEIGLADPTGIGQRRVTGETNPFEDYLACDRISRPRLALANEMARIAFAILRGNTTYREIPA
jgi:hypothetical protein